MSCFYGEISEIVFVNDPISEWFKRTIKTVIFLTKIETSFIGLGVCGLDSRTFRKRVDVFRQI